MTKDWIIGYLKNAVYVIVFYFLLTLLFDYLEGEKIQIFGALKDSAIFGFIFAFALQFINNFREEGENGQTQSKRGAVTLAGIVDFVIKMAAFVVILTLASSIIDTIQDKKVEWLPTIKQSIFIAFILFVLLNFSRSFKEKDSG